jgi:hypothetical protein
LIIFFIIVAVYFFDYIFIIFYLFLYITYIYILTFICKACGVGSSISTAPCCEYFFGATPGWDASTGLGSPNFKIISNLVINNSTYFPYISAYPNGESLSSAATTSDDEVETKANNALYIGIAGLSLAFIVGLAVALVFYFSIRNNKYGVVNGSASLLDNKSFNGKLNNYP